MTWVISQLFHDAGDWIVHRPDPNRTEKHYFATFEEAERERARLTALELQEALVAKIADCRVPIIGGLYADPNCPQCGGYGFPAPPPSDTLCACVTPPTTP